VPFSGDGQTSAAVVTVMLICACEPLPSILSGLLFGLGVAFEAYDALFDICTAVHEITLFETGLFEPQRTFKMIWAYPTLGYGERDTEQVDLVVLSEEPL